MYISLALDLIANSKQRQRIVGYSLKVRYFFILLPGRNASRAHDTQYFNYAPIVTTDIGLENIMIIQRSYFHYPELNSWKPSSKITY